MSWIYDEWAREMQPELHKKLVNLKLTPSCKVRFFDSNVGGPNSIAVAAQWFAKNSLDVTTESHSITFHLSPYPACCAMYQLNHFSYFGFDTNSPESEKMFHQVMDTILHFMQKHFSNRCRRVVLNVVESNMEGYHYPDPLPKRFKTKLHALRYPGMYTWAKSHPCQELVFVNPNSNNLIHFMEVAVDH